MRGWRRSADRRSFPRKRESIPSTTESAMPDWIPAVAQVSRSEPWIPAVAGMTGNNCVPLEPTLTSITATALPFFQQGRPPHFN